jgi:DNA-binding beta-propeller fold protein YncE
MDRFQILYYCFLAAFNPKTSKIYVAKDKSDVITVISSVDGTVIESIRLHLLQLHSSVSTTKYYTSTN